MDDYSEFPYENYPESFQEIRFSLKALTNEEQDVILQLNQDDEISVFDNPNPEFIRLSIPTHQFGGVPFLLDPQYSN